jgi:glutaredoxin
VGLPVMDLGDQIELEHILFSERKCRVCSKIKNLLDDYYLTRKNRGVLPSSYSYECKDCTKKRILDTRKNKKIKNKSLNWEYPDW